MKTKEELFIEEYGAKPLIDLFESISEGEDKDGICVIHSEHTNAINKRGRAILTVGNKDITVDWISGNNNGDEIVDYSEYDLPEQKRTYTEYRFMPDWDRIRMEGRENLQRAIKITGMKYRAMSKSDAFIEKQRAMNYDYYFEPTNKTHRHYEEWANKRWLKIRSRQKVVD